MPGKDIHTLIIEKLVPGGFGLGRLDDGIVVLVGHVLPGEKVLVREVKRKKDFIAAALVEIVTPSPDRIAPPCPVYGRCGGCDLQHAEPEAQLRLKKAILADSLQRAYSSIHKYSPFSIETPLASPRQLAYRQRLRLQVIQQGGFGFFRAGTHSIEPISQCFLAKDALNRVLLQLHSSESFNALASHCASFELLFNPEENVSLLVLHFLRKPRPADNLLAKDLPDSISGLATVLMQVAEFGVYDPLTRSFLTHPPVLATTETIKSIAAEISFSWEVGGFCQVNLEQNSNLIDVVMEMVAGGPHKRILDLYCGYGNFSLPAARLAGTVLGIDAQNSAIRSALRNAEQNNNHNCHFAKKQVPVAVNSLIAAGETFETIILDPPRQGASDIVSLLPKLGANQIIYISCNPATLARDLVSLTTGGYQLTRLVPVDMFPQTHHLETVALLKRSSHNRLR